MYFFRFIFILGDMDPPWNTDKPGRHFVMLKFFGHLQWAVSPLSLHFVAQSLSLVFHLTTAQLPVGGSETELNRLCVCVLWTLLPFTGIYMFRRNWIQVSALQTERIITLYISHLNHHNWKNCSTVATKTKTIRNPCDITKCNIRPLINF